MANMAFAGLFFWEQFNNKKPSSVHFLAVWVIKLDLCDIFISVETGNAFISIYTHMYTNT